MEDKWIKITDKKGRNKTKPPVGVLVILGYNNGKDSWVVAGSRDKFSNYWNQFLDDPRQDADCYPTHWMPLPEPPKE